MAEWSLDLSKWSDKAIKKVKNFRRNYAFALYSSIVKKTPVDTGRARANWNVSVNKIDSSITEEEKKNGTRIKEEQIKIEGDEKIYISNNLPYIETLEYGGYPNPPKSKSGKTVGGYSKQAPNGMVGVTLANNENIQRAALARALKDD